MARKQALFLVNGEPWSDYFQSDNETDQEFSNEVEHTAAMITREAYREYSTVNLEIRIGEVK